MKYFSAAPAAVLLAASIFTAGCGQVHVGTVDRERVQNEAPQLQSLVAEANTKLAEAQAEAQQRFQANPNMTPEEAQQVQMDAQRKMAGLNQVYSVQLEQKMDAAVQEIVKDKKLDVVMDSSKKYPTVISGGTDLPDEVIQKLQ